MEDFKTNTDRWSKCSTLSTSGSTALILVAISEKAVLGQKKSKGTDKP